MKILRKGFNNTCQCECPYCGSLLEYNRDGDIYTTTQVEYEINKICGIVARGMVSYEEIKCPICESSIQIRRI